MSRWRDGLSPEQVAALEELAYSRARNWSAVAAADRLLAAFRRKPREHVSRGWRYWPPSDGAPGNYATKGAQDVVLCETIHREIPEEPAAAPRKPREWEFCIGEPGHGQPTDIVDDSLQNQPVRGRFVEILPDKPAAEREPRVWRGYALIGSGGDPYSPYLTRERKEGWDDRLVEVREILEEG